MIFLISTANSLHYDKNLELQSTHQHVMYQTSYSLWTSYLGVTLWDACHHVMIEIS
jgi:hypothetical protein